MKRTATILFACATLFLSGCEDVDLMLAASAGVDAVKAVALSDEAVKSMAVEAAQFSDSKHTIAADTSKYYLRLKGLVEQYAQQDGYTFNVRVYEDARVNAFAMADGTIRIYSGLMDMMDDGELLFVIGHEMGHVVKDHVRKKIRLSYAARAVRKGTASVNNEVGAIAGSQIGAFAEKLLNAQFSQKEEKEADDYGLGFLQSTGYSPEAAVSALRKLATLGNNHSFLSSHPDPDKRADRLAAQLQ